MEKRSSASLCIRVAIYESRSIAMIRFIYLDILKLVKLGNHITENTVDTISTSCSI
jgi:hypothetical protein